MAALPVLMARLPFSSARVWVGPPLFAKEPRLISEEVFVVAQALTSNPVWVTRLFAAVAEPIRFTVPLPA